jgi:hypothetical protein
MTLPSLPAADMTEASCRVLRRRRQLITACIHVDDGLVNRLEASRVITEQQATSLRVGDSSGFANSIGLAFSAGPRAAQL